MNTKTNMEMSKSTIFDLDNTNDIQSTHSTSKSNSNSNSDTESENEIANSGVMDSTILNREYVNTDIFNPKLLFTQLGMMLYRNNAFFENIDLHKITHGDQSSLFIHVSTRTDQMDSMETVEFRECLENIKTLIFQDERLVAATLRNTINSRVDDPDYILYEYPVGEELLLFNTTLAQKHASLASIDSDNSISLEYFEEPEEEWDMCTKQQLHLNDEKPRYWCIFPSNSNPYTSEKENIVNTLFYSIFDQEIKEIFNRDVTVCYKIIFQHPELHREVVRPKIYVVEINRVEKEVVDQKIVISPLKLNTCEVVNYLRCLSNSNPIHMVLTTPKYMGRSCSRLGVWEKCLNLPIHIRGIQILHKSKLRVVYNPLHTVQYNAHNIREYMTKKWKSLKQCMDCTKKENKAIAL